MLPGFQGSWGEEVLCGTLNLGAASPVEECQAWACLGKSRGQPLWRGRACMPQLVVLAAGGW
jgi:hypothetical protein